MKMQTGLILLALAISVPTLAIPPKTLVCENGTVVGSKVLSESNGLLTASLEATQGDFKVTVSAWQPLPGSLAKTENVNVVVENAKTGMTLVSGNYIVTRQLKNNNQAYLQYFEKDGSNSILVDCVIK